MLIYEPSAQTGGGISTASVTTISASPRICTTAMNFDRAGRDSDLYTGNRYL